MTKPAPTNKKPRKQHTPEFRDDALKLAEWLGRAPHRCRSGRKAARPYGWPYLRRVEGGRGSDQCGNG
ncbi:hypothetical protein F5986_00610 [Dickeya dianthicola]|uniref:Transposase n=1 Tax=Dickeya dianthicola TaxID=204039 RepID=A0AAX1C6X1_9GAMM|nr:hypothetical protein [Dickeya dianthicola]MZH96344.1 hypothetical protein [Dickeya dianthicola]PWD73841.1 hypothetical protein DF213_09255 [Dickeya dianthicola]